jgi:HD superfamily phosphodiesterase
MNFINKTKKYASTLYDKNEITHGWSHILSVRNNALTLQKILGGDKEIIEIASYLHDCNYSKGIGKHAELSAVGAKKFLKSINYTKTKQVIEAILNHSAHLRKPNASLEAKILFDADKIETIKPYGILRVAITQKELSFKEMIKKIQIYCIDIYKKLYFDETRKLVKKYYYKTKKIVSWLSSKIEL